MPLARRMVQPSIENNAVMGLHSVWNSTIYVNSRRTTTGVVRACTTSHPSVFSNSTVERGSP